MHGVNVDSRRIVVQLEPARQRPPHRRAVSQLHATRTPTLGWGVALRPHKRRYQRKTHAFGAQLCQL
jgi:hypothetical protein